MSAHLPEFLDLCAGHAIGALDAADRARLEAHLAEGCAECEAELRRLSGAVETLAASVPQLKAPAALRSRVLDAVRAEAAKAPTHRESPAPAPAPPAARPAILEMPPRRAATSAPAWGWAWAAAAAVLAIVSVVQYREASRLSSELAQLQQQQRAVQAQLDEERAWAALAAAPNAVRVALAPTPAGAGQLTAHVTFDPATRRALLVCENFTAPAGHDYELWAIRANGPESLGVVHAGADGRAVVRLADVGPSATLGAFAVSLEQSGGSPSPHAPGGPVVMVGKIAG